MSGMTRDQAGDLRLSVRREVLMNDSLRRKSIENLLGYSRLFRQVFLGPRPLHILQGAAHHDLIVAVVLTTLLTLTYTLLC